MKTFYRMLLRVRPQVLVVFLKRLLGIRRRNISTVHGAIFWIDPVSHFGGEILETHTYEPEMSRLLKTLLRPGDVFLDVGGNEGYFSVLASNLVERGRVFCIEPQSRLIPVIQKNLQQNSCERASVHRLAFSDRAGEAELNLTYEVNTGGSSFFTPRRWGSGVEKVPTQKVDHFLESQNIETIRLMKVDCEGAESLILSGAQEALRKRKIQFLAVEFHPQLGQVDQMRASDRSLRDVGYRLTRAGNGLWIYHPVGLESELAPLGEFREVRDLITG